MIMRLSKGDMPSHISRLHVRERQHLCVCGGNQVTEHTALYSPEKLLALDGIDELERMKAVVNPFWNRARLDVTWSLPVMAGMTES